jgi:hypothetical protein
MGLGSGFVLGGAIPPELGPHPLTLDFSPTPMHPDIPRNLIPAPWGDFNDKLWDSGLYALLALHQAAAAPAWTNIAIPPSETKVIGWVNNVRYVTEEIEYLRSIMENDRAAYLPEILAQHDNAPFYWISMLGMTNGSKPASLKLMQMAMRIGEMAAIVYKKKYMRVRPSTISPGLAPPFGPPGHPAFPSGHSLQAWLITYSLMEVTRPAAGAASRYKEQLKWLAKRVAANRERAGLHYPSDSAGGRYLAVRIFDILKNENNTAYTIFQTALDHAKAEWGIAPP